MTGTQSLSFAELQTIWDEVGRLEIEARRSREKRSAGSTDAFVGQPVTIVIHQADKAWVDKPYGVRAHGSRVYRNIPEASQGADKKVQVHRAYADSRTFWISRDGEILHRFNG